MLGRDEVARLAKARGLRPWQEEKRYVQALVLYSLREAPLVLKGGTYLWFFHGLDRFSDDLDFTAEGGLHEDLAETVVASLSLFGVSCGSKRIKEDRHTTSFRVDARGPLFTGEKDRSRVYVEVSRREEALKAPISVKLDEAPYSLPIAFLRGMALDEVAAEKVRALLTRAKARDLYDLWYLVRRKEVKLDRALLDRKMVFYGKAFDPERLYEVLEKIGGKWLAELVPIVIGEVPPFEAVKADLLERLPI